MRLQSVFFFFTDNCQSTHAHFATLENLKCCPDIFDLRNELNKCKTKKYKAI